MLWNIFELWFNKESHYGQLVRSLSYHFYIFILESLPTFRSGNNSPTRSPLSQKIPCKQCRKSNTWNICSLQCSCFVLRIIKHNWTAYLRLWLTAECTRNWNYLLCAKPNAGSEMKPSRTSGPSHRSRTFVLDIFRGTLFIYSTASNSHIFLENRNDSM